MDIPKGIHPSASNFVGVILAAGIGSRLRPLTNTLPKCMVKVAGTPIIGYQINAYRRAGINEIIIVVGYKKQVVIDYCKHIKDIKFTFIENPFYERSNNMYSFYLVRNEIGERPFILNNGDVVIDPHIVNVMLHNDSPSAVAVDRLHYNEESMKVIINDSQLVCDISKTITKDRSSGCSIDFYKFSLEDGRRFINIVSSIIEQEKNVKDWTEIALQRAFLSQQLRFSYVDITGLDWVEIDNYDDLAIADRKFSDFDSVISDIQVIFLDLDGTVYVGNKVIPGAPEAISKLRRLGKKIYFLSNNSSKDKTHYVTKLLNMGVSVSQHEIILSSDAVLSYLKSKQVQKIYVLGTDKLKTIFSDAGFLTDLPDPEYVVIGYDTELNYEKLKAACAHINRGVDIVATHRDVFCPSEVGPIPDAGALLELIRLTTGKSPIRVFGKPDPIMVHEIVNQSDIDPSRILVVGDRIYTDIQMAKNIGARSLLVLTGDTGETTRDMYQDHPIQPDFCFRSLADI